MRELDCVGEVEIEKQNEKREIGEEEERLKQRKRDN